MKKNMQSKGIFLILLAMLLLVLLSSCDARGEKGEPGEKGASGANGKSAYELAVENGYTGTLDEWLASLVGVAGAPGTPGTAGVTPKLQIKTETNMWEVSYDNGATWESLNVPATGDTGAPGASGTPGTAGVTPKLQINTETNMWEVSYDNGATWKSLNVPATGENGAPGAPGIAGVTPKLQINAETNMWEVSYDNGVTWESLNVPATGENGAPGAPGIAGVTPKLQINAETNMWEVSYDNGTTWESLNVPATGDTGAPGASGTPGTAGVTPKLQINAETNMWEVSYDNGAAWESLNVPATGDAGTPGAPGASGLPGNGVTDAYINSDYHLILLLSDGTKIDAGYVGVSLTPSPELIFTVTFTDYDGTVLDIQTVKSGEDATPPECPVRDGYIFNGWDGTYTNITADCTIVATYISAIPRFAVTFVDHDGTVLSVQAVRSGESATPPTDPIREGYIFVGWVGAYTDVAADSTVIATYTASITAPAVVVDECVARRGVSVAVTVAVRQNPGIASMKLTLVFDNTVLTLNRVVYNTAIGGQALLPQSKQSPLTLNWFNGTGNATGDFVFATLYFSVSDEAAAGNYMITASYNADDIYNIEETNIDFAVVSGKITVTE